MSYRLRQNSTNVSEMFMGLSIYVLDVQYVYIMSNVYNERLISISNVRYLCLSPSPCPSRVGYCISDIGYRYRTSDIGTRMLDNIGRPIYILDIRYIYWTSHIGFGNIGGIFS